MTMFLYPVRFKDDLGLIDAFGTPDFEKAINLSNTLNDSEKLELSEKMGATKMQSENGHKSEKLDQLFEKLDAFVQIVYPPTNAEL